MADYTEAFVAFDVAKIKHAVVVADSGRAGEVRFLGEVESRPATIERTIGKLAKRYHRLHVCFEAGPTGYGLLSAGPRSRPRLHGGCAGLDPKALGRADQDEPTGCGHAGAAE